MTVEIFNKILNISNNILFNAKSKMGGCGINLNNKIYHLIPINKKAIDNNIFKYTKEDYNSITISTKVFFVQQENKNSLEIIDLKQNVVKFIEWIFKKASSHLPNFNHYLNQFDKNKFCDLDPVDIEPAITLIVQTYLIDYFKKYFIIDVYHELNTPTSKLIKYNISYTEYINALKRASITRSITNKTLTFPYNLVLALNESFWTII